jgi:hypothetical protein
MKATTHVRARAGLGLGPWLTSATVRSGLDYRLAPALSYCPALASARGPLARAPPPAPPTLGTRADSGPLPDLGPLARP